jgi:hypothetical protein
MIFLQSGIFHWPKRSDFENGQNSGGSLNCREIV